ncbi:MAG: HD domain-containing protein [Clostridiaceae bacterium]|nr:HD domain-containing protein [Clostridiaceae bacterium]
MTISAVTVQQQEVYMLQRKVEELENKLKEQSFLVEMMNVLVKDHDLNAMIKNTLHLAMQITHSEAGCLYITDNSISKLKAVEINGNVPKDLIKAFSKVNKLISKKQLYDIIEINKKNKLFPKFKKLDEKLESFIIMPLIVGENTIGYAVLMHRHDNSDNHSSTYSLEDINNLHVYSHQAALLLDNIRINIERNKKEFYLKTVGSLIAAIDAKDIYTQNHSSRVAKITVEFSRILGFPENMIETMHYGALLHDVGKIGVSDTILNKPGNLTEEEFSIIKEHPIKGVNILAPMDLEGDVLNIIKYHHERYDGRGYPEKLKGEEIPLVARIVSIIDTWDAMTSDRSYRKKLPIEKAIQEFKKGKGLQFDPYLVDQFLMLIDKDMF